LPEWAEAMTRTLQENGRIAPVDIIGCPAAVINAIGEELLEWMAVGVRRGEFTFPESNGPVRWSNGALAEALRPGLELMQRAV
jgi:hypothetical protein